MKEIKNYEAAFLPILLLCAGILSPSNGVDDQVDVSTIDLLGRAALIMLCTLALYGLWSWIEDKVDFKSE